MSSRTVSVKLMADVANFTRNIGGTAVGATKSLTGELDKASKAGKMDKLTNAAGGLGIGLLGVAAAAVKMAADFDKQMSAVSAATNASTADMGKLRQAAIQAGKDTMYSATQAAEGETELAKAGISTANILNGGLKGALDLAAAGQISVSEAAETAASAMTQFKLSGSQVPHVADLLAAAAGKAQGGVHEMGYALNQSGLVASQFGLSIEDTTGVLAEFAHAGLLGSDAGTSFRTMLLAMANPTGQTKAEMDKLGISFYDAQGKFIGMSGVAQVLQDKLKGLTQEQRNQALGQIFGNDAIRAASILYSDGAKGVQNWAKQVYDSGYASRNAAKLTDNLAGDLERLKGSFETLAIQAGGGANTGLRALTQSANFLVNAFTELPGWIQTTTTVLSGVGGASLLAAVGFLKARSTASDLLQELRDMGPAGEKAAGWAGKFGSVAGKLGAVGIALAGAFEGLQLFSDWMKSKHAPIKADIDGLTDSMKEFAATGVATGELARHYGDSLQKIGQDVTAVTKGMADLQQVQADVASGLSDASVGENWNPVDPQAKQDVADLDTALTALVKGGGASQAQIFLQRLAGSGRLTSEQFRQLSTLLPNYSAAASGVAAANTGMAKGFGDATANSKSLTAGLQAAIDAGQSLTDVWKQLNGALLGSDKAELDAKHAIDAVTKSFKDNGKSVDESGQRYDKHGRAVKLSTDALRANSEKALQNKVAVGEAAQAAAAAAQAKFEETDSVSAASKTYDEYIGQLRATLHQSGLTKTEIDKLIGSYAKMPDSINTKLSVTGAAAVSKKLTGLLIMQEALKKGVPASAIAATNKNVAQGFAMGGWTGPGSKYAPAGIVHADEFVIQKDSRRKIEKQAPGLLDRMNTTGMVPGYARGGLVAPFPVNASVTKIPSKADVIAAVGAFSGPAPHGALAAWISSAEGLTGTPSSWSGPLNVLIQRESGGNPRAINLSDSNAKAGDPSRGLMQTIGSTFEHYRLHSLPDDIYNPVANIVAGIRYIKSRYGSIFNVQQANPNKPPKGYWAGGHVAMAGGGVINEPVFGYGASGRSYSFGEGGRPETVIPGVLPRSSARGARDVHVHAPISINGANQSPDQIATAVSRQLGRQIDLAMRSS